MWVHELLLTLLRFMLVWGSERLADPRSLPPPQFSSIMVQKPHIVTSSRVGQKVWCAVAATAISFVAVCSLMWPYLALPVVRDESGPQASTGWWGFYPKVVLPGSLCPSALLPASITCNDDTVSAANAKALLLSVQSSQECTLFWDVYVGRHVQQYMPTALLSKQDTSVLHIH